MFRHDETYLAQRRCLTHHLREASLAPILPARVPGTATLSRVRGGSGFKRSTRGRVLASSVVEIRAILLSPYCAELAGLELQRFRSLSAFTAGCCPLFLSEPGKPVFLEHPSNSSRLHQRSQRACHGARSQHRERREWTFCPLLGLDESGAASAISPAPGRNTFVELRTCFFTYASPSLFACSATMGMTPLGHDDGESFTSCVTRRT